VQMRRVACEPFRLPSNPAKLTSATATNRCDGIDRLGLLSDPVLAQVIECHIEHWLQLTEVGSVDADLGGEDDLLLSHGGLHVVGLAVR
jgi:hypothetical protein